MADDSLGNLTQYGTNETMSYDALSRQTREVGGGTDFTYFHSGGGERTVKFPAGSVLRREMARYISEANMVAKGWTLPAACPAAFPSDPNFNCATDPDSAYINLVAAKGITQGCDVGKFCPENTITRAEMAVFLVRGYKPDGFNPPACTGMFTDVPCSGSIWSQYAKWIEQLARDGVTAGCGGTNFCPGSNVGEWEMVTFLNRAPGGSGLFWGAYHPVPRGTVYTVRDEQNRIVREVTGPATGPASAVPATSRDNLYLGNLLVASFTPAIEYYTPDHLGTPRYVRYADGTTALPKYWPYGELVSSPTPPQRLGFAQMERDDEGAVQGMHARGHLYDHARTHDFGQGRFASVDRVSALPGTPQSWNRYLYSSNNPVSRVDRNGLADGPFFAMERRSGSWASVGRAEPFPEPYETAATVATVVALSPLAVVAAEESPSLALATYYINATLGALTNPSHRGLGAVLGGTLSIGSGGNPTLMPLQAAAADLATQKLTEGKVDLVKTALTTTAATASAFVIWGAIQVNASSIIKSGIDVFNSLLAAAASTTVEAGAPKTTDCTGAWHPPCTLK